MLCICHDVTKSDEYLSLSCRQFLFLIAHFTLHFSFFALSLPLDSHEFTFKVCTRFCCCEFGANCCCFSCRLPGVSTHSQLVSEQKFHIIWQFDASTFGAIKTTHNSSWGYSDRTHISWKWGLFGESLGDLSRNTVTSPRAKPKAKPTLAPSNKAFQMWTIKINRKTF